MRDPHKFAMLKPRVMRFEPDWAHMDNCTLCENQDAAVRASRRLSLAIVRSGAAVLLADEAALSSWVDVVHELEVPRKQVTRYTDNRSCADNPGRPCAARSRPLGAGGFGMPGTVTFEDGRYRAWLGQARQHYFESNDGLTFYEPRVNGSKVGLRWAASPGGIGRWGELGQETSQERPVEQQTFTVMVDGDAAPEERYKASDPPASLPPP